MSERPKIDQARVLHVARLASLSLDAGEVLEMVSELGRIVGYVEQLAELDTDGVPPMTGGYAPGGARRPGGAGGAAPAKESGLRDDEVRPGLSHEEALDQAPRAAGGGFAVPRFLDSPRGR